MTGINQPEDAPWGLSTAQSIALVCLGMWMSLCGSVVTLGIWRAITGNDELTNLQEIVAGSIGLWIGMASVWIWILKLKGGTPRSALGLWADLPRDAFMGIGLGIAAQLALLPIVYLPLRYLDKASFDSVSDPANEIGLGLGIGGMVAVYIFTAVLAPVMEELFFRGFAYRVLFERFGSGWAVGITTLVFGLIHFQKVQTIGLLAVGLMLGWLRWKTGRLGPSIFAHCAFNGTALMVVFLA